MSREALLVFPAQDRIIQALTLVVFKEITDIGVVLKLPVYLCPALFLFGKYLIVCAYSIRICLPRICFQPFLEQDIERKALAYLLLEKRSVLLRTYKS